MPRIPRFVFVLLLAAALGATAAWAEEPLPASRGSSMTAPLAQLWNFLTGLWSKNGCQLVPNGLCRPGTDSATPAAKNGCQVDPQGNCRP